MDYRRVLIILGTAALVLVVLLGGAAWFAARTVSQDAVVRSISPWVGTLGSDFRVANTFDAADLPNCAGQERPLDAILVIDRSSSMADNDALAQAIAAAVAFADVLNSPDNRTGAVLFNKFAQTMTPLGASVGDMRVRAASAQPDGGTAISAGLAQARSMLQDEPRPSAAQVVVLLSDGGAQDTSESLQEAQTLKDNGVHLITVALPGGEAVPGLLESVATSSQDFYAVDQLPDLSNLFRELAMGVRSAVATDIRLTQPYSASSFAVNSSSLSPSNGTVAAEAIEWRLPSMGSDGASFQYTLDAKTLGWHEVAATEGTMTLMDCTGTLATLLLPIGPKVLISPIPPWMLLLLPFLFFVPLFLLGRGRNKDITRFPTQTDTAVAFDFHEQPPKLGWMDELQKLSTVSRDSRFVDYPDALVIGVGDSGTAVLGELRRLLVDQNNDVMPSQIRLLAIKAALGAVAKTSATDALAPDEQLILAPNLNRVVEQLQSGDPTWAHLQWWGEHTPDDAGRAGARMALFYDLMLGEGQSQVWRALRKRLDGLKQPLVYVVAGLADPSESGMALDLPHFIKEAAGELGTGTRRVMAVFMLQRTGSAAGSNIDAGRYTYASIRELQRILLREPFSFSYNPSEGGRKLVGSTVSTPIDACYLIDGVGEKIDLSGLPETQTLYPTVSDTLLTLLSSGVAKWHQDYVNTLPTISRRTEETTGLPTISSFNCSVVQYPMTSLSRIAKYRFLLDLVFGGQDGKAPLGLARLEPAVATPKLETRSGLDGLEPRQRSLMFLKDGGKPNRHPLMRTIAEIMEGQNVEESQLARLQPGDRRIDDSFRWALRDELLLLLNGIGASAIANRSGKLGGALTFLSALVDLLKEAESGVPRRIVLVRQPELRQEIVLRITNWRRTVENTLQDARLWETALVGEKAAAGTATARSRRRQSGESKSTEEPETLYQQFVDGLEREQGELQKAGQPMLRMLIDSDPASQEELYQRYLGPDQLRSSGIRPLELALARVGWLASVPQDRDLVTLRLVVIPSDASGSTPERQPYTFRPDQLPALYDALDDLAGHFIPLLAQERLADHLQKLGAKELTTTLLQGERALVKFDRVEINRLGGTIGSHLVLTLSDSEIRRQVEDNIRRDYAITAPVEGSASDDPYRISLVGLTDAVPIKSLEAIDLASLDYASDTLAHVFSAEQAAARLERDWRTRRGLDHRFHPRFVRLLDNEELARSLAVADLYGLIGTEKTGTSTRVFLKLRNDGALTQVDIATGEQLTLYDTLYQAYYSWLKATPDHPLSRGNWPRTAAALRATMAEERRGYGDLYAYLEVKRDELDERFGNAEPKRADWVRDVEAFQWLLAEQEKLSALTDD